MSQTGVHLPDQEELIWHNGGGAGDEKISSDQETERRQTRDDSLRTFLQHLRMTPETLLDLASEKESFGFACVCAFLITKLKIRVSFSTLDLSGLPDFSPTRVSVFLSSLPLSVEELVVGPQWARASSLPAFRHFLQRVSEARSQDKDKDKDEQGEGDSGFVRVKSFVFTAESIGPSGAPEILPLVLPGLQKLCLKGNSLAEEGGKALAAAVETGKADCLQSLDLQETGLQLKGLEGLKAVCTAINKKPLQVLETLCLSDNWLGDEGIGVLCDVLCVSHLPCVKELRLRECGIGDVGIERLAVVIKGGHVPCLEVLDLEENRFKGGGVRTLASSLRVERVPRLKKLNLVTFGLEPDAVSMGALLQALTSEGCPTLEDVQLSVGGGKAGDQRQDEEEGEKSKSGNEERVGEGGRKCQAEENLRMLGAGRVPVVRTISLRLEGAQLLPFFEEVVRAPADPPFVCADLSVEKPEIMGVEALTKAMQMRRFGYLRKLNWLLSPPQSEALLSAQTEFLSSFCITPQPLLIEMYLPECGLSEEDARLLGGFVRDGHLPALRLLDLEGNDEMGNEGARAIVRGLDECEVGLPPLEQLDLDSTDFGLFLSEIGALSKAGKLNHLSILSLSLSLLDEDGLFGLAEAVQVGALVSLSSLYLEDNPVGDSEGWRELFRAVGESEKGLPKLQFLGLRKTSAGEEAHVLATAIQRGKLPALRDLNMEDTGLKEEGVKAFADLLRTDALPAHQGSRLVLGAGPYPRLDDDDDEAEEEDTQTDFDQLMAAIVASEKGLPGLSSLDLSGGVLRVGGVWLAAGLMLGKLPSLSEIRFSNMQMGDSLLEALGEAVKKGVMDKVTKIKLMKNSDIGSRGVDSFLNAIAESRDGLPKLSELYLYNKAAGPCGLSVAAALGSGKLPCLKSFGVCFACCFDSAGMRAVGGVFKEGKCPPLLEILRFHYSRERADNASGPRPNFDPLLAELAEREGEIPGITEIDLSGGVIGKEGMCALAAILGRGNFPKLTRVCICSCHVENEALTAFADAFRSRENPNLTALVMNGNRFNKQGVAAFLNALPPQSLRGLSFLGLVGLSAQETDGNAASAELSALVQKAQSQGKLPLNCRVHY
uniref:Uncharacterized protein n=1 Tax=Chromera velia CCMP2878 TaxID=1169474 RepID=A0A0G4GIK7_9ALVE|eukprot:Cvel_4759.t1-p1 / transcript=Cvel_4759.t1 / gene=Cvel_4759 / organism=Chromera_velia_CCMP2878 / gene_product=hypothetical protein / transcript_product=hypothetical protein / location=Cvel_scaffold212:40574-46187(+) / protein_length=1110 / sequence_SO=supercontig / SO=protein_coding / is_pseudo=false